MKLNVFEKNMKGAIMANKDMLDVEAQNLSYVMCLWAYGMVV